MQADNQNTPKSGFIVLGLDEELSTEEVASSVSAKTREANQATVEAPASDVFTVMLANVKLSPTSKGAPELSRTRSEHVFAERRPSVALLQEVWASLHNTVGKYAGFDKFYRSIKDTTFEAGLAFDESWEIELVWLASDHPQTITDGSDRKFPSVVEWAMSYARDGLVSLFDRLQHSIKTRFVMVQAKLKSSCSSVIFCSYHGVYTTGDSSEMLQVLLFIMACVQCATGVLVLVGADTNYDARGLGLLHKVLPLFRIALLRI